MDQKNQDSLLHDCQLVNLSSTKIQAVHKCIIGSASCSHDACCIMFKAMIYWARVYTLWTDDRGICML